MQFCLSVCCCFLCCFVFGFKKIKLLLFRVVYVNNRTLSVRACLREYGAYVRACVRACVCVFRRACVRAYVSPVSTDPLRGNRPLVSRTSSPSRTVCHDLLTTSHALHLHKDRRTGRKNCHQSSRRDHNTLKTTQQPRAHMHDEQTAQLIQFVF